MNYLRGGDRYRVETMTDAEFRDWRDRECASHVQHFMYHALEVGRLNRLAFARTFAPLHAELARRRYIFQMTGPVP